MSGSWRSEMTVARSWPCPLCSGMLEKLLFQVASQLAYVLELGELIAFELDAERFLDAEHQVDVRHRVPAFNIGGGHAVAELQLIVVEYSLENVLKAIMQRRFQGRCSRRQR